MAELAGFDPERNNRTDAELLAGAVGDHRSTIEIPATAFNPDTAARGNANVVGFMKFATGSDQSIQIAIGIPPWWGRGEIECTIVWSGNTGSGSQAVRWLATMAIREVGDQFSASPNTLSAKTITVPAATVEIVETTFSKTISCLASDRVLGLRIRRQGNIASDDYTDEARLYTVKLTHLDSRR